MADIKIHREHDLGLSRAREIAWAWAEQAESKFDMSCTVLEGKTSDTVEFVRSGVKGQLIVAPDHFELEAKLGLLLGAFKGQIEREIEGALDALLAAKPAAKKKAAPTKKTKTG
jgi:putative polyhydroxyalkanoate system protein